MTKKIIALILSLCLIAGCTTTAFADSDSNISVLTHEEYVTMYAEKHAVSYSEAEDQVLANTNQLISAYYTENNIIMPRSISYYNGYQSNGVWYYYADVYKTYDDGLAEITYHTYGLVLHDNHSDIFLGTSSDWMGDTWIELGSGSYTFINSSVYVNLESSTSMLVRLLGTIQIETQEALSLGFSIDDLLDLGYTQSGSYYYRSSVSDSFRQLL